MWRVVLVLGFASCSTAPDLTCAVLADPSNCFTQQAAVLAACMPMRATSAKLSSDQMTCTFADGVYVVFLAPLPRTDVHSSVGLNFTVYNPDGSECGALYYDETSEGTQIDLNKAASWDEPSGYPEGVKLHCPSHTYDGSLKDVQSCAPYVDLSLSPVSNSVTLGRTGTPAPLFSCQP